jgi:hypothetical protein
LQVDDPLAAPGAGFEAEGGDGEEHPGDEDAEEQQGAEEEEEGGVRGVRSKAEQRRQEQMVKSIQVLDAIVKRVIPNATRLYLQGLEVGSGGTKDVCCLQHRVGVCVDTFVV